MCVSLCWILQYMYTFIKSQEINKLIDLPVVINIIYMRADLNDWFWTCTWLIAYIHALTLLSMLQIIKIKICTTSYSDQHNSMVIILIIEFLKCESLIIQCDIISLLSSHSFLRLPSTWCETSRYLMWESQILDGKVFSLKYDCPTPVINCSLCN